MFNYINSWKSRKSEKWNIEVRLDLSYDGWVSVNDILMEEGHAYEYDGGKKKVFNG